MRRSRAVALGGAVALVAAVLAVLLITGGASAPAQGAAKLVPARALVYLHADTDPGRASTRDAIRVLERFRTLRRLRDRLLAGLNRYGRGTPVDFARDIRPWLGSEAAFALIDTSATTAGSVIVVAVRDERGAREFLQRLGTPTGHARYRGAEIMLFGARSYAFVGGYLVLGPLAGVQEAIDADADPSSSLAEDPVFRRAASGESGDRVADAYVSVAGLRRLLVPGGGLLGTIGRLLDQPGLQGVSLSLSAGGERARLRVHWALAAGSPGVPAGLPLRPFTPSLAAQMPAPVSAFVDAEGLDRVLPRIIRAAGRLAPELAGLGTAIAPLLSGETAISIVPGPGRPDVLVVARVRDETRARVALATLQGRLAQVLAPAATAAGQSPTFTQRPLAGYTAFQLRLGPTLEIDYAVGHGEIAVSTNFALLVRLTEKGHRVAGDPDVADVLPPRPGRSTSLVFLALNQLLDLGEQAGLGRDPRYRAVRDDLRRIRSVGLRTQSGEAESTAEITLLIP